MNWTGAKISCRSGAARSGDERTNAIASPTFDVSIPAPGQEVPRELDRPLGREQRVHAADRRDDGDGEMVLEVPPDGREIVHDGDPVRLEIGAGPDARRHQQLR